MAKLELRRHCFLRSDIGPDADPVRLVNGGEAVQLRVCDRTLEGSGTGCTGGEFGQC